MAVRRPAKTAEPSLEDREADFRGRLDAQLLKRILRIIDEGDEGWKTPTEYVNAAVRAQLQKSEEDIMRRRGFMAWTEAQRKM